MPANNTIRDSRGRFQEGTAAGPGRPQRETEQRYLDAFRQGLPPEKLAEVVSKLSELAINGDVHAARTLLQFALPIQARLELLNQSSSEPYRVAGCTPEETNFRMVRRIMNRIEENRKRDKANGISRSD